MESAPKLDSQLMWESFWDLSTMRVNGMGMGPIPLDKLHWYANVELGYHSDEIAAFVWIMRRVDAFFVNKHAEQSASKSK